MPDFADIQGIGEWIRAVKQNATAMTAMQTIATVNGITLEQATMIFVNYVWPYAFSIPTAFARASQVPLHASWIDYRDRYLSADPAAKDSLDLTKWLLN